MYGVRLKAVNGVNNLAKTVTTWGLAPKILDKIGFC